jgi:biotin carboxyl carrier protein
MPGLITSINISEGDKIRNGQNLLIIEAMKMENSIIAECSGKVKKITASVGDNVGAGDVLIILD